MYLAPAWPSEPVGISSSCARGRVEPNAWGDNDASDEQARLGHDSHDLDDKAAAALEERAGFNQQRPQIAAGKHTPV